MSSVDDLNADQQKASKDFFAFLMNDEPELIISGAGGVGKTFLMGYLIDEILPQYHNTCELLGIPAKYHDLHMTATTNKAAEVLSKSIRREVSTIHSFLGLKVVDDYVDGTSRITKTNNWRVLERIILFIDESPMIDKKLLSFIREATHNCKVVYVGDREQLAPVSETLSQIYTDNLPFCELTIPMRNAEQPALVALCEQLRNTVKTLEFQPIKMHPGVIDWLDDTAMELAIEKDFMSQNHNSRILAYTNRRVIEYNDHIRHMRNLPAVYTEGERLILGSALQHSKGVIPVETEVTITYISPKISILDLPEDGELSYQDVELSFGCERVSTKLPVDRTHYQALVKYYQKRKLWNPYFKLKNTIPDLRPREASTVHKSQGSTYDTVYIDATDLSSCHLVHQAARLLYVAVTRAKTRIVFYGNLANKYGGLVS